MSTNKTVANSIDTSIKPDLPNGAADNLPDNVSAPEGAPARTRRREPVIVDAVIHADHPHTDPGDGRVECDTCGKWVHPVIHSCKGFPVTYAAAMRQLAYWQERSIEQADTTEAVRAVVDEAVYVSALDTHVVSAHVILAVLPPIDRERKS